MEKEIASLREWYKSKGIVVLGGDAQLEADIIWAKGAKLYEYMLFWGDGQNLEDIVNNSTCPHLKNEYKQFKQRKNDNSEA